MSERREPTPPTPDERRAHGVFSALMAWHLASGSEEGRERIVRQRDFNYQPSTSVAAMDAMSRATHGLRSRYKQSAPGLAGAVVRSEEHRFLGAVNVDEYRDGAIVYSRAETPAAGYTHESWRMSADPHDVVRERRQFRGETTDYVGVARPGNEMPEGHPRKNWAPTGVRAAKR